MSAESVLLRARVPAERLKRAEAVLERLGLKPGDAINMFLAQIELRQGLPFEVSLKPGEAAPFLAIENQADIWAAALGDY